MTTSADAQTPKVDPAHAGLLPVEYCLEHGVVLLGPAKSDPSSPLAVGMIRPGDRALVDDISSKVGRTVVPVEMEIMDLRQALGKLYDLPVGEAEGGMIALEAESTPDRPASPPGMEPILLEAIRRRATDIHIEAYGRGVDLRYRIDGVLQQVPTTLTLGTSGRLISRIKVLCGIDLTERRRAQDGRFSALYSEQGSVRRVDFRASILPGPHGQDLALRVLDPQRFILDLGTLGMTSHLLSSYRRLTRFPHGLLLATGPTGAGKTTTLYATLRELQNGSLKIVSVEDPVEYEFTQVNQKNVTPQMGFADHLRAFLRSNPDVIHVGEIRDADTAEIAIRAGTTGHLVLGTLHTRDAVSSIARLRALGVADDYLSEVLIGVLGQRLVRRLCDGCKEPASAPDPLTSLYFEKTPTTPFFTARGCDRCEGTGFRGLVGVYELFEPSDEVTQAIGSGVPVEEIRKRALATGWKPLVEDALEKAAEGMTSLAEIARRIPPKFKPKG